MRTILERLECSFARQEAKLDQLLDMSATVPPTEPQTPLPQLQASIQPHTFSTPYSFQEMERLDTLAPRAALQEVDDTGITGNL